MTWPELADDRKALLLRARFEAGAAALPAADESDALQAHAGEWVAVTRRSAPRRRAERVAEVVAWLRERGERGAAVHRVPADDEDVAAEHGVG